MYFRNYRLRKTWLDKCMKSPASKDSLTREMVNRSKHSLNLHGRTFIIFIDHCEGN